MSIGRGRGWRARDEEIMLPKPGQVKNESGLESKLSPVQKKIESMVIQELLDKPFILTVMELFQQNTENRFQFKYLCLLALYIYFLDFSHTHIRFCSFTVI